MDFSVNSKRRRDSEDSLTEEGEKKHIKKHPKQKHIPKHPPCLNLRGRKKNHKITSSTRTTSSNNPSPTATKKYPN